MTATTVLTKTGADIIKAALRKLKVIGIGETPETEDYTNCLEALNILIKAKQSDGFYLWKITNMAVPLLSGVSSYMIGPTATGTGAVVTDKPLKIQDSCYLHSSTTNTDIILQILSRQEYNSLGNKLTQSVPTNVWYDAGLANGTLKTYGVVQDNVHTVYLSCLTAIYTIASITDTLDFPSECYQALVYGLAEEMMTEYPSINSRDAQIILQKSAKCWEDLTDNAQEVTSIFLMPDSRNYRKVL
jgi:hypothetical protein